MSDPVQPEAPKIIRNISWLREHGKDHLAEIAIGILALVAIAILGVFWNRFWATGQQQTLPQGITVATNSTDTVIAKPATGWQFLNSDETPTEILRGLNSGMYNDAERQKLVDSLYVGRRIRHPWNASVSTLPIRTSGGWTFGVLVETPHGHEVAPTVIESKSDASSIRISTRIHFVGNIRGVGATNLYMEVDDFQIID